MLRFASCLALALVPLAAAREETGKEFVPLFDGKTLDGWVRVNNAPGTFAVKDGEIVTTGTPTGFMRSAKRYENFVLEMEWKHLPPKGKVGNSGLFVWCDGLPGVGSRFTRGIEVQVLVNLEYRDKKSNKVTATSHGDVFSVLSAKCEPDRPHPLGWPRCLPSENNAKGEGEWNHYRVTANDGSIKLAVNGKEVTGVSKCSPRMGYLALESEGTECRFRNIKIKELPSTKPAEKDVCPEVQAFEPIFTGLDLAGWSGTRADWKVGDNTLSVGGKAKGGALLSEKRYGDVEVVLDARLGDGAKASLAFGASPDGPDVAGEVGLTPGDKGGYVRYVVGRKGREFYALRDGKPFAGGKIKDAEGALLLRASGQAEFSNLFARVPK